MTSTDPYDAPLSAILGHAEDLGTWLGIWRARAEPDAYARRCAADAVSAINAMLRDLHDVRSRLVTEIRTADDAAAAQADVLLAEHGSAPRALTGEAWQGSGGHARASR
jgi:hypothetical protein